VDYLLGYTKPDENPISGLNSNPMESFTNKAVTNNVEESYQTETLALVAVGRYTDAPTTALKDLIDVTIAGLKTDGVFTKVRCLWVRSVHESLFACQNWARDASNSTLVNAPTFTPKVGFKGNGSTSYINNNYIAKDDTGITLDNLSVFHRHSQLGTATARCPYGMQKLTAPTSRLYLLQYTGGTPDRAYVNSASYNGNVEILVNQSVGYVKTAAGIQAYVNGVPSGGLVGVANITELPSLTIYELARNAAGTADSHQNSETNWHAICEALTDAEALALHTRMEYFIQNVSSTF
jgi:hypothetical protein